MKESCEDEGELEGGRVRECGGASECWGFRVSGF